MRVAVLGGTQFIDRAIVEELVVANHELIVIHRGQTEPPGLADVKHIHTDRQALGDRFKEISAFRPEALIDTHAMSSSDAQVVLETISDDIRMIVLSSADVYRAYEGLQRGLAMDPVPLTEESPVRQNRYPYRGKLEGMHDYEKLDVEETYAARNATILRLPFVYGEHDYQRREEFVLRRVRARRDRMPFGVGNFVSTRGYVRDIARGVRLVLESPQAAGQVMNLGEPMSLTIRQLAEAIVRASGADLEFVSVPDELLPLDLRLTGAVQQHYLIDSTKARDVLGWNCDHWETSLKVTVDWHLSHPPANGQEDFAADDSALEGT